MKPIMPKLPKEPRKKCRKMKKTSGRYKALPYKLSQSIVPRVQQSSLIVKQCSRIAHTVVQHPFVHSVRSVVRAHWKWGVQALCIVLIGGTVIVTGSGHVSNQMVRTYTVTIAGKTVGTVSTPEVLTDILDGDKPSVLAKHPELRWNIVQEEVRLTPEYGYGVRATDAQTRQAVQQWIASRQMGIEIFVRGQLIGTVRDEKTVDRVLERLKDDEVSGKHRRSMVALAAAPQQSNDNVVARSTPKAIRVRITDDIELRKREINPALFMDEYQVIATLAEGNAQRATYIVQEGDTPSGIAQKQGVPLQLLYENNAHMTDLIEKDLIRIGDVLDLTYRKPLVSIESETEVTETIELKHEVMYEEDATLKRGETRTVREGRDGLMKVTYRLKKLDGFLFDEDIVAEDIIIEPIPAVIKRGTKRVRGEGTGKFLWPVRGGSISSGFGRRWGRQHKGIDITSSNKAIRAADNGRVVSTEWRDDYGKVVIIDHDNGYKTLYAHLSKVSVDVGDVVERGDRIGTMGSTGRSTGVHLHFEVLVRGVERNPLSYLRK
jgi:murein DD-endopeptidase MepM/ murein hydrolase activator NlpD